MENKTLAQAIISVIYFLIPLVFSPLFKDNFIIKDFVFFTGVVLLSFVKKPVFPPKATKAVVFFIFSMFISLFFASNFRVALYSFSKYFIFYISIFYLAEVNINKIFRTIFYSSLLVMSYGVFQKIRIDFIHWQLGFSGRVFSFLGNPNFFSSYLVSILPVYFYLFEKEKKSVYFACFLFNFLMIFFTKTRGSIIAGIVLVVFLIYFSLKNNFFSKRFLKIFSIFVLLFSAIFILRTDLKLSFNDSSIKERIFKWKVAFAIFKRNPVFGCGIGNVKTNFALYQAKVREKFKIKLKGTSESKIHNDFFQILSELGIFGFVIFLYLLFVIFKNGLSLKDKVLTATIISGVIGIVVNSLSNFPLQLPATLSMFILYVVLSANNEKKVFSHKTGSVFLKYFILLIFLMFLLPELLADYYRKKGNNFFNNKNYKKAIYFYEKAHKISPINGKILYELGMSYVKIKNYEKAIRFFKEGIKIRNYGELYNDLGNAYYLKKDIVNAIKYWEVALKLGLPDEEAYKSLKKNLYLLKKKYNIDKIRKFKRRIK